MFLHSKLRRTLKALLSIRSVLFCIVALLVVLCVLVALSVHGLRTQGEELDCRSNLKSLGTALLQYGDYYGCLPPPCITDSSGKPLYSWRVLILPSYSMFEAYDAFDFTKRWDDPGNMDLCQGKYNALLNTLFSCPSTDHDTTIQADYLYALNALDKWPRDFFYNVESRVFPPHILLVERRGRSIHWSEPVDLDYQEPGLKGLLRAMGNSKPAHKWGSHCFNSDGSVERLPADANSDAFMRILGTSARPPKTAAGSGKEEADKLVGQLMKILDTSTFHSRHQALLLLGELGPQAKAAVPLIRQVIAEEQDMKLKGIAAFALAKIQR
ncbi:MAG: DUF1559 domain-containing protein [Acidobacteriales bacterium]|nr:DUF1559 domain-containing protein [Terriglobales bacterium]